MTSPDKKTIYFYSDNWHVSVNIGEILINCVVHIKNT